MSSTDKRISLDRQKARLDKHDFALTLSRSLSSQQIETIISIFNKNGFKHLLVNDEKLTKPIVLFLAYDDVIGILKQAGNLNIHKKCYTYHLLESKFKLRRLLDENKAKNLGPEIRELEETEKFTFAKRKDFLFIPETVKRVENVQVSQQEIDKTIKEAEEQKKDAKSLFAKLRGDKEDSFNENEPFETYLDLFTPSEITRIIWSILNNIEVDQSDPSIIEVFGLKEINQNEIASSRFVDFLKRIDALDTITPLHNKQLDVGLESINNLTDYFGQNVGIYFKFMEFYTKWLIPPAIFGVVIYLFTSDKHPQFRFILETLYSLMIMIWATLFVEFWQRRSSELSVKWHTYSTEHKITDERFDFQGMTRINLVTGLPNLYFPLHKRLAKYAISFLIHLPVFLFGFMIMVYFLNIRGYVDPNHIIFVPSLAQWSYENELFDKTTHWKFIPTILQVVSMVLLGKINKKISYITTRMENQRTRASFNNSLIIKRFLFEVLYTFSPLAYIGFWRRDNSALKIELIALYASDEFRRLIVETLIPYLMKTFTAKKIKLNSDKKNDDQTEMNEYIEEKIEEISLASYDSFDDYMEMIIQFGYITLFAASFPLSGAFSLLFNGIEVLSDYYKLKHLYKRPMPRVVDGLGSWKDVIDIMSYLCVITNCILIGCNSLLRTTVKEKLSVQGDTESEILTTILITEHLMLVGIYLIKKMIKNEPFWVRIYLRRNASAAVKGRL